MEQKKTIIYIMSDVRSGSTLLENILSKSPDIVSVGELHHLDSHLNKGKWGETINWVCSCGKSFDKCEFWTNIIQDLKRKKIFDINKTSITSDYSLKNLMLGNKKWNNFNDNYETINLLNEVYDSIFSISNKEVIIDSSKNPEQGIALYQSSKFNIKVIFIKRDIRAITLSKYKWKLKRYKKAENIYRILYGSKLRSLFCYKYFNEIDKKDKILIEYKNLAHYPQKTIDFIAKKFNISKFEVPQYMYLENDHTVGGTPSRFQKRKIEYDYKWKLQVKKKPFFRLLGKFLDFI